MSKGDHEDFTPHEEREESAKRQARAARERQRRVDNLLAVCKTREGREFLHTLIADCGLYRTSLAADAMTMAAREGERNVALRLMAQLGDADPRGEVLATMQTEARSRALAEQAAALTGASNGE